MAEGEAMRIVTGCKTPEQFVSAFHRFCDAKTCFIPTADTRPVGSKLAFSLRLADGTPMLRGTCVVKHAWKTAENQFKRPGVQLEIDKLTAESSLVFEQLLSQKTAIVEVPRRKRNPDDIATVPLPVVVPDTPTIEMPPLYKAEKRAVGSAFVLPANPLSDFDDDAVEDFIACNVGEGDDRAIDDDLAIPVAKPEPRLSKGRSEIKTTLGVAPLPPERIPIPRPVADPVTQPFALPPRAPAARSLSRLQAWAITGDERFWYSCALGAVLLVLGLVLASAWVLA